MLIEVDDPRISAVMGLLQHCNSSELKELLNEDARLDHIIRDSQLVKRTSLLDYPFPLFYCNTIII